VSSAVADNPVGGIRPLVIKIGGSLAETGRFPSAIAMIESARVPVIVVPGGGPFADSIRALQPALKFDDATAHRLAMLAMHQMAELIVAQSRRMHIAQTLDEISATLEQHLVPIWTPLHMISGDTSIPADWSATSDTLAARLAEIVGARLLLLKSVDIQTDADLDALARSGIVDPVVPSIVARSRLSWSIFGPADDGRLRAVLQGEGEF
jgi:aspartokinase-like uncharacterized kinase